MTFNQLRLPKQQSSGSLKMVKVDAITNGSHNLCPVLTCLASMDKTADKRHLLTEELFISTKPPHQGIAPKTGARWLLMSMERAGVDTAVFTAHSMCGAAASHKRSEGASLQEIMSGGRWLSESLSPRSLRLVTQLSSLADFYYNQICYKLKLQLLQHLS